MYPQFKDSRLYGMLSPNPNLPPWSLWPWFCDPEGKQMTAELTSLRLECLHSLSLCTSQASLCFISISSGNTYWLKYRYGVCSLSLKHNFWKTSWAPVARIRLPSPKWGSVLSKRKGLTSLPLPFFNLLIVRSCLPTKFFFIVLASSSFNSQILLWVLVTCQRCKYVIPTGA